MSYVIIAIIVIAILYYIISSIYKKIKNGVAFVSNKVGKTTLVITLILCIPAYLAFSWEGVLIVAVCGIGVSVALKKAASTAQVNQETEVIKEKHGNEVALRQELEKNCKYLGYMNESMWVKKLPNYVNKEYESDFKTITENFAKQIEKQLITSNDDWFQCFIEYIANHPQGSTTVKMLSEVDCPHFKATHSTTNITLLKRRLKIATEKTSRDVPALLNATPLSEINDVIYTPTKYFEKLYCTEEQEVTTNQQEFSIDDL